MSCHGTRLESTTVIAYLFSSSHDQLSAAAAVSSSMTRGLLPPCLCFLALGLVGSVLLSVYFHEPERGGEKKRERGGEGKADLMTKVGPVRRQRHQTERRDLVP
jgi:hypothetical protein